MESLVTLDEIRAARERIKSAARYTPMIDVPYPASIEASTSAKATADRLSQQQFQQQTQQQQIQRL